MHIDYAAQFSGDKHPAAAGGGFKQARRGRAGAEGSGEGASIVHRTAKAKTGRRGKARPTWPDSRLPCELDADLRVGDVEGEVRSNDGDTLPHHRACCCRWRERHRAGLVSGAI